MLSLVQLDSSFAIAQTGGVDDDTPSALATLVAYSRSGNAYEPTTAAPQIRVYDSATPRDGSGDPAGPAPFASGQRGWAAFSAQSGRWEFIQREPCSGEATCITVLTGVSKSGANLIFTRKQICLPPCTTITDQLDISIECCEEEGGGGSG